MADDVLTLTADLYDFIQDSEPTLLSGRLALENGTLERLRARAEELFTEFQAAQERTRARLTEARTQASERLAEQYDTVIRTLQALIDELEGRRPSRDQVRELWRGLGTSYEGLLVQIRQFRLTLPEGLDLEHLKPRNVLRNLFHVCLVSVGIVLYEWVCTREQLLVVGGVFLSVVIFMDVLRRIAPQWNSRFFVVFGPFARPAEVHRTPAATWAIAALFLGAWLMPQHAIELGCLALAVGDPAAALIGKRWGRRKLYREKSLAGTLGFFAVTTAAAYLFSVLLVPDVGWLSALPLAAAVALAGALAELFSVRIEDNFTIPLLAGGAAMLLL